MLNLYVTDNESRLSLIDYMYVHMISVCLLQAHALEGAKHGMIVGVAEVGPINELLDEHFQERNTCREV